MYKFLLGLLILSIATSFVTAQTCDLTFENWENTTSTNPPEGWQSIDAYIHTLVNSAYSGDTFAGMNNRGEQWIVKPLICPDEICFFWRASGASSNYDLDIDWSIDNGATWTTAHTITLNGNNSPLTYAQLCVDLPEEQFSASSSNVLIRFHQSRRSGGSFYLEDVCVSSGNCTITPSQLTFSDLQAGCIPINTSFSINICATNAGGLTDDSFTGTLAISSANLQGTLSQNAVNGCATFNDLQFSAAGDYSLSASSEELTGDSELISVIAQCPTIANIKVMAYNLLNFPNGRDDCGAENTVTPARWDSLRKIVQYVQPDVLMVCELQSEFGADMILSNALNVFENTRYARADFVVNQSPGGTALNNAFFYNTDKMTLYAQGEVTTNVRDIGEYVVFLNDPNLSAHGDTTFIDFYTAHFKAGSTAENATSRASQCASLDDHTASKNEVRNAIIGGDFNFYTSTEPGYQALLNAAYPFFDPLNAPGDWNNNANFKALHTQSTRPFNTDQLDCGATGGIDSRFDFLLNSESLMNGTKNVTYVTDSYQILGNDGNSFNAAVNDLSNQSGVPDSVLNALRHTSDHLPVIMDLTAIFPTASLAIDLLDFDLKKENSTALLSWETLNNEVVDHFVVQESKDNQHFTGAKKIVQRSNNQYLYQKILAYGITYFRIKKVTVSGAMSYSNSKSISHFAIPIKVFPNPFTEVIHVQLNSEQKEREVITIKIHNALGQLVYSQKNNFSDSLQINTINWQSGIYVISINLGGAINSWKVMK